MKLSHRDFRPQRRSKYVVQPPKRRPTLRILLLAVFATLVYLKFDSFVSSKVFQTLAHPKVLVQKIFNRGEVQAAETSPIVPSVKIAVAPLLPTSPLKQFQNILTIQTHPAKIEMVASTHFDFHSILPGRIVEVDSQKSCLKIYHGKNIYSSYSGKIKIANDLAPGKMVTVKDTLGWLEKSSDTLIRPALSLQIENNGLYENPEVFLSLVNKIDTARNGK